MPLDAHATEEEDKLILLSSLSRLGGCTQEQLLRFLAESGLMNPFQFYLALGGLKEAGFIREARHMEGALLFLTPQGRESRKSWIPTRRNGSGAFATNCRCPPSGKRRITVFPSRCARWKAARKSFP